MQEPRGREHNQLESHRVALALASWDFQRPNPSVTPKAKALTMAWPCHLSVLIPSHSSSSSPSLGQFSLLNILETLKHTPTSWPLYLFYLPSLRCRCSCLSSLRSSSLTILLYLLLIFISLAMPGLSCRNGILSCGKWDLVPWPGIEPASPALGVPLDCQGSPCPFYLKLQQPQHSLRLPCFVFLLSTYYHHIIYPIILRFYWSFILSPMSAPQGHGFLFCWQL